MNKKATFSNRLVALMTEQHKTVKQVADVARVATSTVQAWRSGVCPTDFEAIEKIANFLGVSFSFLLLGKDDTRPDGPPTITEVFDRQEDLFEGYALVKIQRLFPKKGGNQ